jgi:hypothetical protein
LPKDVYFVERVSNKPKFFWQRGSSLSPLNQLVFGESYYTKEGPYPRIRRKSKTILLKDMFNLEEVGRDGNYVYMKNKDGSNVLRYNVKEFYSKRYAAAVVLRLIYLGEGSEKMYGKTITTVTKSLQIEVSVAEKKVSPPFTESPKNETNTTNKTSLGIMGIVPNIYQQIKNETNTTNDTLNGWNKDNDASKLDIKIGKAGSEKTIIKFKPSGDDEYKVEFENRIGQVYNFPFVSNENGDFKFGDDDNNLIFTEGKAIEIGDYFIVTSPGEKHKSSSHVIRWEGSDRFNDLAVGIRQGVLVVGGYKHTTMIKNINGKDYLAVDLNGDGEIKDGDNVGITTNNGGVINFYTDNKNVVRVKVLLGNSQASASFLIRPIEGNELDLRGGFYFNEFDSVSLDGFDIEDTVIYNAKAGSDEMTMIYFSKNFFAGK